MDAKAMIKELKHRYPEFCSSEFVANQQGWANLVLVAEGEWIFRIARNREAGERLEFEKAILPKLKKRVKLKIPDFQYSGVIEDKSFVGYRMIAGVPLTREQLVACKKEVWLEAAKEIAEFLSVLHAFDPAEAGLEGFEEKMPDPWQALMKACMQKMPPWLSQEEMDWIQNLFADFDDMRKLNEIPKVLIHADFTDDHILFDMETKRIAGIIDFGDLQMGDPALDFAGVALTYGDDFLREVLKFYRCEADAGIWDRIHYFYAQQVPLHGLLYGIESRNPHMIHDSIKKIRTLKNKG